MSLNKVMLIGNVGKDPEVRYLESNPQNAGANPKVATFPLATSERYRDRSGDVRENTEWHNIVAWRGNADVAEKYIRKGTQIYVEGRLRTRQWQDQTGNKRYTTEIVVDTLQLLGKRPDGQDAAPAGGYAQQGGGYAQQGGGYAQPAGAPAAPAAAPAAPAPQAQPAPGYAPQAQPAPGYASQPGGYSPQPAGYAPQPAPAISPADAPTDDLPF